MNSSTSCGTGSKRLAFQSALAAAMRSSDDETKFLMTSFYKNLKTRPKAEALRQAQLETKKKHPHPFYWSAFQLTGMGK